ncbi:P-loop NTPase fold protein [Flavobacterium sp. LHD-85]|uniref:KAP family P-loop NTPase fold protein n=1 Tax=Flavobacterium sp. LHD-85 TaxID=3071410 RepID=UPI0027DEB737|nr:P-loop NTPase fold protein [Flavobacterium sp. LHD-85]MDQ6531200.1 P-loop NTPase fold protein [Flavobacterium sp. LHD-85]
MRIILKLKTFLENKISFLFLLIMNLFGKILFFLKSNFKFFFSWLVLFTIVLIFQNKVATFLGENSIIEHVDVKKQSFKLAFVILVLIFLIRFFWFIIKNYRISQKQNYFIFLFSSIYFFLRNDENDSLYFSYLSRKHDLYYSDIILLIAILSILLLVRNIFLKNWKLYDDIVIWFDKLIEKDEYRNTSFLIEDTPLNKTDINDNEKVIDEVVNAVINLKPSNSFIIGINSIWGIGKTSFLKRLEYKLTIHKIENEGKPITFWFNAWQHQDEKSIINNFFNQLKKELSIFSGNSKNSIDNYLIEMFALVDNKYLNFFKSITNNIFSEGDTIKDSYDEINNIIEEINRRIIVFVDDIDRLNKTEILETLRILRNIADFKNIIFVCGFDREYVVKQSQIDNHYLDKIFNLEINLTTQNERGFISFLNELINEHFGNISNEEKTLLIESINKIFYDHKIEEIDLEKIINLSSNKNEEVKNTIGEQLVAIPLSPSFFFESRRDVKKFYNELYINIQTLKSISDIDLEQYVLLKLLLFKYKWMHKNFASKRIYSWLGNTPVLKFEDLNLNKLLQYEGLEYQDKFIIFSTLVKLFPANGLHNNSQKINQKRYFPIYFSNNVFNECLSYTQLLNALKDNEVEELINNIIKDRDNEKLIKYDIKTFLLKEENIFSTIEFMQVVDLIKKGYFDLLDELEINNFLYIGFLNSKEDYVKNLDSIFTNFHDSFGLYLINLHEYYIKIPSTYVDRKDIEKFEMLDLDNVKKISLRIFSKEIENKENDVDKILSFHKNFYEVYFTEFKRGFFYEDFKIILKKIITDNFEAIFFRFDSEKTFMDLDVNLLYSLFEDVKDRNKFIEILNYEISGTSYNEAERGIAHTYEDNGFDNFIEYYEKMITSVSTENLDAYKDFLDWLHTYKDGLYVRKPKKEEVEKFKNKTST